MLDAGARETERKIVTILKVLSESSSPLGSVNIARGLENHGIHLSQRAVRYHLKMTDERGFTRPLGRDGTQSIDWEPGGTSRPDVFADGDGVRGPDYVADRAGCALAEGVAPLAMVPKKR